MRNTTRLLDVLDRAENGPIVDEKTYDMLTVPGVMARLQREFDINLNKAGGLVIFARWRPELALVGALFFGLADSLQYRIQALATTERGAGAIPYEFLLMLPYFLTLVVLLVRVRRTDSPSALGRPYIKGER